MLLHIFAFSLPGKRNNTQEKQAKKASGTFDYIYHSSSLQFR